MEAQPVRGVVWTPPGDDAGAMQDLLRMEQIGVQAVRTGLIEDPRLLRLADRLGLQFYQELPVDFLSAQALRDTLEWAGELLQTALERAGGHPSARHFGLARFGDTSSPRACAYFDVMSELAPPNVQTYYVTAFVENDRCADEVDFVLFDALGAETPSQLLTRRIEELPNTAAGLAAVGAWTDGRRGGLAEAHSLESQARYLEETLGRLLGYGPEPVTADPVALFVYRWRSADDSPALPGRPGRSYALLDEAGNPRPAALVLGGMYTGEQTVFAFPAGESSLPDVPWLTLFGWGVVALLGGGYAGSPRFRRMAPRYFGSHGFYREAIQEGRDVMAGISFVLLGAVSISTGIIVTVQAHILREGMVLQVLLGGGSLAGLGALLAQPWLMVLVVAGIHAAAALFWGTALGVLSRRRYRLGLTQCLALIVWPRWTFHVLMVAMLVIATLPPSQAVTYMVVVSGIWAACILYAVGRAFVDFARVTRVSPVIAGVAAILNPILLALLVSVFVVMQHADAATFLWHLATRS